MKSLKILRTDLNKQRGTELAKVSVSQISTQGIIEIINELYTKQNIE